MRVLQWISFTWCELMHPAPRWPINGFRECPTCLGKTRVAWGLRFERLEHCLPNYLGLTVYDFCRFSGSGKKHGL